MSKNKGKKSYNGHPKTPLDQLFLRGQFAAILAIHKENPAQIDGDDESYVVGALAFSGKLLEAEEVFKACEKKMSAKARAEALFFLGVGYTRKSQYSRARVFLRRNKNIFAANQDAAVSFYAYQGIAFYLYFTGQFYKAEKYANESLRRAIRSKNFSQKILSQDLLGHISVQTGRVFAGLSLLRESAKLAIEQEVPSFSEAIAISTNIYEAQYGHRPHDIVSELEERLDKIQLQDNYSRANIILELARQYIWRGRWAEAERLLNSESSDIFARENRRQEITLNLRWAELAYLKGHNVQAMQYLRSSRRLIDSEADKNFAVQVLELETRLLEEEQSPLLKDRIDDLLRLSDKFANKVNLNMLSRRGLIPEQIISEDDSIHTLLLELERTPAKAQSVILSSGYLAWFYRVLPIKKGVPYLVLGLPKGQSLVIEDAGLRLVTLPKLSLKLIGAMASEAVSKSSLVETLWQYEYHPFRHDPLVHSAMSTLRKCLGAAEKWIQTTEDGYQLMTGVEVFSLSSNLSDRQAAVSVQLAPRLSSDTALNDRQIQALEHLQEHRFISTREYKKLYKTSEITACRDLASLRELDLVVRVGHGRSIKYSLKGE